MLAPAEYYEQLKCSICECVLSKFPIYTKKTDNNQLLSICGRCQVPSDDQNYLRNEIYETLAKLTLFPCINREYGCMDDLLPGDVAVHELQCPYRLKSCIINQNNDDCKSEVCFINLIDHYQTKHADLILKDNQFKIDTTKIDDIVNILQYRDEMFIFQHNFYPILKHFNCTITPIGFDKINKTYYGQINLKSELCTINHKLPEINVIDGENDDKQQSNSLYINIENMLNEKNADIVVTISLTIDNEQLNNHNKITENSTDVKCYKCSCKIDPPIYQCSNKHYVCSVCKSYSCKCGYPPSLSLLNLNFIISQCKYGCGRSFNVADCSQHENICPYRLSKCLLDDCEWKDCFKDMIQHLLARHEGKIIEINEIISTPMKIYIKKSDPTKRNDMLVKFSGNLFKLVVQYKNPHLLWRLELIDIVKQQNFSNFYFEITLFDQKRTKRVSFKESCTTLTHNAEYEINDMPCIWLHTNQFANLLLNNRLLFKINISK